MGGAEGGIIAEPAGSAMFKVTLLDLLRLSFGGVAHDYRAHSAIAERLTLRVRQVQAGQLGLLAIALVLGIMAFVRDDVRYAAAAAVFTGLALVAFALYVAINLESRIYAHRWCASRLWLIREKYLALLSELPDGALTPEAIGERRDQLIAELHAVVEHAPLVDRQTYASAREARAVAAEKALTDEEIDAFLPPSLRKSATAPAPSQQPG